MTNIIITINVPDSIENPDDELIVLSRIIRRAISDETPYYIESVKTFYPHQTFTSSRVTLEFQKRQ